MRKSILVLVIIVSSLTEYISANSITKSMAVQIAKEFNTTLRTNSKNDPSTGSGTSGNRQLTDDNRWFDSLASKATDEQQPYYVISRGKDRGFIIVSGDDRQPVILGYTDKGDFEKDEMPPQLLAFLKYFEELSSRSTPSTNLSSLSNIKFATSDKEDIEPLIQTHWHQSAPYNNKCPLLTGNGSRSIVGCVATAASQVLYYFHKDAATTLQASTPTYGYGDAPVTYSIPKGTPLKWDLMLKSYGTEPEEYRDAVATMCFATGAATWLTYGSSTGGHVYNLPTTFADYYNLNSTYLSKGSMTQTNWENTLYGQLSEGRPMVFAGFTTDGSTGHAIVVDGYQKVGNLFHFNFGWGGQADGYYTTVDGKGPGDFSTGQEILYKISPKKQNLKTTIKIPKQVYASRTNNFKVTIANNGTLDYSGVYFFANMTGKEPSSLSSAATKDEETVFSNDGKEISITMPYKPLLARHYYFFVTDKNLNILAQMETDAVKSTSDLELQEVSISGSSEKKNGYTLVYNEKTEANFVLTNNSDVPFEGSFYLDIYGEDTDDAIGQKTATAVVADDKINVCFDLTSKPSCPLNVGTGYRAVLQLKTISGDTIRLAEGVTNGLSFMLKGKDLTIASVDSALRFTGHWDEIAFSEIISTEKYDSLLCYDMRDVKGITTLPRPEKNPNALYLVASEYISGSNAIFSENACKNLFLDPGYNYNPLQEFKAKNIEVNIHQEPNRWYLFTSPADFTLPDGMTARKIKSHNTSGITSKTENVTALERGKTYMLMTSSAENQTLTAIVETNFAQEWLPVVSEPAANTDSAVKGLFVNTSTPSDAMVPDTQEEQYFSPVGEGYVAEALRGYFYDSKVTKAFRANSDILKDPAYATLGKAIEEGRSLIKDSKVQEATATLSDSLCQAEKIFTKRELNSTQTKAFTANLQDVIEWYKGQSSDEEEETDYTRFLTNPSFEDGKTTGWDVEDTKSASIKQASNNYFRGVGSDGDYLLYNLSSEDSTGCMISQTITGLPEGYYRVTAMLGTDDGYEVTLFANDSTTTVTAHPFGLFYLSEATTGSVYLEEGEALTFGVKAGRWYKADNFRLLYHKADDKVLKGDANDDGVIDVADITAIAAYILGAEASEASAFNIDNADVNDDKVIDVADITATATIILGQ